LDRRAQASTALPQNLAPPGGLSNPTFRVARHRLKRRAAVVAEFQPLGIFGSVMSTVMSPSRSTTQFVEEGLGVFEVGGVEAFCEPVVNFGEHRARLFAIALSR
jgi:hypothetical protein